MLRLVCCILIAVNILVLTSANQYDGYKLYDVVPKSTEECDMLRELFKNDAYDFFTLSRIPEVKSRFMISPDEQSSFLEYAEQNGLQYKLVNDNFGKSLEKEFDQNRLLRKLRPVTRTGRLSTERYYTHNEINEYIEQLANQYSTRVFVKMLGKSYEKRKLQTITITNGDGRSNKNVILIDGGFHAREWISPAAVLYVIEQLVENFDENRDLLLDYDWVILPVVNADGYEYTQQSSDARLWRKTRKPQGDDCIGTDPNRNFDFHWNEEGASSNPCSNTFAGPHAFSEPETVVVRDLMHSLNGRGIFYLTVHSCGQYLLYPWGWTYDLPDTVEDLHEVAQAGGDAILASTGTVYTVGSSTSTLYIAAGASDDYAFEYGFPISITMELPCGGDAGFDPPPESIDGMVTETWTGIKAMAQKVIEKYPLN